MQRLARFDRRRIFSRRFASRSIFRAVPRQTGFKIPRYPLCLRRNSHRSRTADRHIATRRRDICRSLIPNKRFLRFSKRPNLWFLSHRHRRQQTRSLRVIRHVSRMLLRHSHRAKFRHTEIIHARRTHHRLAAPELGTARVRHGMRSRRGPHRTHRASRTGVPASQTRDSRRRRSRNARINRA